MALRHSACTAMGSALALALSIGAAAAAFPHQDEMRPPLTITSGRVSLAGTSNIHEYTASTTALRVTRVQFAAGVAGAGSWESIVKPGALEAFEIAIPAASLSSPKQGLDKNMHKALKTAEHANMTFRLTRLEARAGGPGALRAIGFLTIAGVEREIAFDISTSRKDSALAVHGETRLLMTDFGIAPPKAMLGMLKTDPEVTITFETLLAIPLM